MLDERIIEYDVDRILVDYQSAFQRIQIVHTLNYGNLLILDENQSTVLYDVGLDVVGIVPLASSSISSRSIGPFGFVHGVERDGNKQSVKTCNLF